LLLVAAFICEGRGMLLLLDEGACLVLYSATAQYSA
jgi:hypothetical protein